MGKNRKSSCPLTSEKLMSLDTMRSKGFLNRERDTGWAVLAHNLWVIARLPRAEARRKEWKQAA